jgi:hypothetical protein
MPNRRLAIATYAVGLALILSLTFNAYLVRVDIGGWALWNAKEAYFFIGSDTIGSHVKWAGYPLMVLGEMLGRIEPPDDHRLTMYIMRVTSAGLERHVLELTDLRPGSGPGFYTPLEGRIWANWPTIGGLCWWAGDHFEKATPEEQRRLGGLNHLKGPIAYRNEAGWSADGISEGYHPEIKVGDEFELHVLSGSSEYGPISVEMSKPGSEPKTLFTIDSSAGLVSRSEYRRIFHGHQ